MKNKRIEVGIGKTLNMGDYEFLRVDIRVSADVDDEGKLNTAYKLISKRANVMLSEEVEKQMEGWK